MTKSWLSKYWGALAILALSHVGAYQWIYRAPQLHSHAHHSVREFGETSDGPAIVNKPGQGVFVTRSGAVQPQTLKRPSRQVQMISERLAQTALRAPDPEDRVYALTEIALLKPTSEILSACYMALKDRDIEVRLEAISTLEELEDLASIDLLTQLSRQDPSLEVQEAAQSAVEFLRTLI